MINAQSAAALEDAAGRSSKRKQDKANPMVIHVENGRLMPNTPNLRKHAMYRVYGGDIHASLPERMKWLQGMMRMPRKVVNTTPEDVFDIGTSSAEDLAIFALEEYGQALDPKWPLKKLRTKVAEFAAAAESPAEPDLS